ncbi:MULTISPECIES: ParB N-terminal domain-containing protein [Brevundimonas]|jgi:ParB family chromosome partitioning protein|uniref:ParB family chromosome partitioning protein n=1 Tax=Brevundimonas vesicularis TaxID=41276 RepID=A0A7W9FVV4_BREVE|nr:MULTISPECIES: ParB N-terminal domain-containing protein [Brevundimonas]KDP94569.1 chromosome partitioning protein ParB [Brevundimonas sp. EAKA]MBB5772552.1 ParB family chromosome partitioning protein [Brevundimonas vesicularis]
MTDLVPVITSTTSVPETPTPAVIFTPVERIVRLGDLGIARENLRYGEPPDDDIPTLAATLKAAGQLQPVTVRPGRGKKEQPFMALDGRRRRLALASLLEAGDIDEDYPVRTYVETDPARQAAAVLLTNTAVPVHVADVIAAIGRMLKSKLTITAMARALGYDEIEIKRLAALSGVAPAALVALKAGRITLRQTRLLARLPDLQEQKDIAQMTLDGQGFQEWRVKERLDDSRVTTRDRRCALVDPQAYADAGGRTESDLFGELPPVLLDPDILTEVWTRRARGIAAVFEAEGISVHVTAGPEPELPDDLEALGYVYGGSLPAEEMARYRAQREVFNDRTEKARIALADVEHPDVADLAIVDMIHAKIASDQTGCGGRVVTTMVLWPAAEAGVEVRCYTPEEPEIDEEDQDAAPEAARRTAAPPAYVPPEVEAPEPETEGVNHALHAVRTDVATRGLIRALADDPGAALTALIARLFTVLVRRAHVARSDSALAITASGFNPANSRVIEALDGDVRRRLEDRRTAWEASGETVIAWVHGLAHGEKMGLLAELTAISLDVREEKTFSIRRSARAEAAELAALCQADITLHWTPDAPFLQPHSKGLLTGMLDTMGAEDERAKTLRKTELVDWVAEQAAQRTWAPAALSWAAPIDADQDAPDIEDQAAGDGVDEDDEGAGAFVVTPAGKAALDVAAA